MQLEAQAQELRQAEEQAQRAQEEQAWVQLKEQEVLQLQVGRGCGKLWALERATREASRSAHRGVLLTLPGDSQ